MPTSINHFILLVITSQIFIKIFNTIFKTPKDYTNFKQIFSMFFKTPTSYLIWNNRWCIYVYSVYCIAYYHFMYIMSLIVLKMTTVSGAILLINIKFSICFQSLTICDNLVSFHWVIEFFLDWPIIVWKICIESLCFWCVSDWFNRFGQY